MLEKQEIEIENANIESISNLIKATIKLKLEYANNITISIKNYSKIGDNDVQELIPEVEIGKFDNQ